MARSGTNGRTMTPRRILGFREKLLRPIRESRFAIAPPDHHDTDIASIFGSDRHLQLEQTYVSARSPRQRVHWSPNQSSWTDMDGNIYLSLMLPGPDAPVEDRILCLRGLRVHETLHTLRTDKEAFRRFIRNDLVDLTQTFGEQKADQVKTLWNIVEDGMIERWEQRYNPGGFEFIKTLNLLEPRVGREWTVDAEHPGQTEVRVPWQRDYAPTDIDGNELEVVFDENDDPQEVIIPVGTRFSQWSERPIISLQSQAILAIQAEALPMFRPGALHPQVQAMLDEARPYIDTAVHSDTNACIDSAYALESILRSHDLLPPEVRYDQNTGTSSVVNDQTAQGAQAPGISVSAPSSLDFDDPNGQKGKSGKKGKQGDEQDDAGSSSSGPRRENDLRNQMGENAQQPGQQQPGQQGQSGTPQQGQSGESGDPQSGQGQSGSEGGESGEGADPGQGQSGQGQSGQGQSGQGQSGGEGGESGEGADAGGSPGSGAGSSSSGGQSGGSGSEPGGDPADGEAGGSGSGSSGAEGEGGGADGDDAGDSAGADGKDGKSGSGKGAGADGDDAGDSAGADGKDAKSGGAGKGKGDGADGDDTGDSAGDDKDGKSGSGKGAGDGGDDAGEDGSADDGKDGKSGSGKGAGDGGDDAGDDGADGAGKGDGADGDDAGEDGDGKGSGGKKGGAADGEATPQDGVRDSGADGDGANGGQGSGGKKSNPAMGDQNSDPFGGNKDGMNGPNNKKNGGQQSRGSRESSGAASPAGGSEQGDSDSSQANSAASSGPAGSQGGGNPSSSTDAKPEGSNEGETLPTQGGGGSGGANLRDPDAEILYDPKKKEAALDKAREGVRQQMRAQAVQDKEKDKRTQGRGYYNWRAPGNHHIVRQREIKPTVTKPVRPSAGVQKAAARIATELERLRNEEAAPQRYLRQGRYDKRAAVRARAGSENVRMRPGTMTEATMEMEVLIDLSGSTNDMREHIFEMATAFKLAGKQTKIPTAIWGYDGNEGFRHGDSGDATHYELASPDSDDMRALTKVLEKRGGDPVIGGGGTPTASAIEFARTRLAHSTAEKKLIVLVTDGGSNNAEACREQVRYAKGDDVAFLTCGFADDSSIDNPRMTAAEKKEARETLLHQMAQIFDAHIGPGNWVPVQNYMDAPMAAGQKILEMKRSKQRAR